MTGADRGRYLPGVRSPARWTCVGAGGGICTAPGSGNINDTVNLPAGGSVTYTGQLHDHARRPPGTLSNTATVAAPGGVTDRQPGQQHGDRQRHADAPADLAITKTDGVHDRDAGRLGDLHDRGVQRRARATRPSATVADTFPASPDLHLDLRGRGRRHLYGGRHRQHQRHREPAGGRQRRPTRPAATISASGDRHAEQHGDGAAPAGVTDPTPATTPRPTTTP